ncbi:MAG: CarD family transcriptional regulator [Gaiellaceae bacterium]
MFEIGDKVVYPHHGAGTVVKREKREILGETREYLTIQILHNDMTVNVPCENAERNPDKSRPGRPLPQKSISHENPHPSSLRRRSRVLWANKPNRNPIRR